MYISNKAFVGLQSPSKVIFKEKEKERCKNVEEALKLWHTEFVSIQQQQQQQQQQSQQ